MAISAIFSFFAGSTAKYSAAETRSANSVGNRFSGLQRMASATLNRAASGIEGRPAAPTPLYTTISAGNRKKKLSPAWSGVH